METKNAIILKAAVPYKEEDASIMCSVRKLSR